MRGDRFSIFREFRSVCKICLNSHGTIYRDRTKRLRLSLLDYPPRFYVPWSSMVVSKAFLFLSTFLRKFQVWFHQFQVGHTLVLSKIRVYLFSVLLAHFPFLFSCLYALFDIGVYPLKLDNYLPNLTFIFSFDTTSIFVKRFILLV